MLRWKHLFRFFFSILNKKKRKEKKREIKKMKIPSLTRAVMSCTAKSRRVPFCSQKLIFLLLSINVFPVEKKKVKGSMYVKPESLLTAPVSVFRVISAPQRYCSTEERESYDTKQFGMQCIFRSGGNNPPVPKRSNW